MNSYKLNTLDHRTIGLPAVITLKIPLNQQSYAATIFIQLIIYSMSPLTRTFLPLRTVYDISCSCCVEGEGGGMRGEGGSRLSSRQSQVVVKPVSYVGGVCVI